MQNIFQLLFKWTNFGTKLENQIIITIYLTRVQNNVLRKIMFLNLRVFLKTKPSFLIIHNRNSLKYSNHQQAKVWCFHIIINLIKFPKTLSTTRVKNNEGQNNNIFIHFYTII